MIFCDKLNYALNLNRDPPRRIHHSGRGAGNGMGVTSGASCYGYGCGVRFGGYAAADGRGGGSEHLAMFGGTPDPIVHEVG